MGGRSVVQGHGRAGGGKCCFMAHTLEVRGPLADSGPARSRPFRWLFGPVVVACIVGLLTTSCELRRKRVLVWHDWPEPEAEVLIELLNGYSELDPDLRLIIEYVPAEEIESRFVDEALSGFGPDVLIGVDADRLADLVSAEVVHPITGEQLSRRGFDQLEERAMDAMAIDGGQHGIPLAGFTDVLYFREGVAPPETIAGIVDLAEEGYSMGIPVDFVGAYWGVDAFDGTAFGADGRLDPDEGFVDCPYCDKRFVLSAAPEAATH